MEEMPTTRKKNSKHCLNILASSQKVTGVFAAVRSRGSRNGGISMGEARNRHPIQPSHVRRTLINKLTNRRSVHCIRHGWPNVK